MDLKSDIDKAIADHGSVYLNLERREIIRKTVEAKEALVSSCGSLVTWTAPDSTGRSPYDTYIVRRPEVESHIDWDSPNNFPMDPQTFEMLWQDALKVLSEKKQVFVTDRVIGADASYALPVRTVTDNGLTSLFTDNMFRPVPDDIGRSIFADKGFTLLVLPYDKIVTERYAGRLRKDRGTRTSSMAIAMDFGKGLGLVYGSSYGGSVKKLMFTVMNYYLPLNGILPLHCSANENRKGELGLFLGLSGTGKTTLSADPNRALLGDDEHGWSENGIANFEYGCYAKLINLDSEKEPEIYRAVFHVDDYLDHGVIIENTMMYPGGSFDLNDARLTPNSRASYPLSYLANIKPSSIGPHPKTIVFLAADANSVLPPVARLNSEQAMLWFLMGYTSKLAGTETGIIDPVSTFSRFFGQPFMPCLPHYYSDMLGQKLKAHNTEVYLINTGWSGGPYGEGRRFDINITRRILNAALDGKLTDVPYDRDDLFHLNIPRICPDVPSEILKPENTWADKDAYRIRAKKLAGDFSAHFDKAYGNKKIDPRVISQCPGK
ncbi:MAG: phosphoenolpyruvate carboxykinase (ATP) [Desulfobacterales bacterium]|jgi:phosphoenolpyruvate carboxykinase (ATP)|nr:phosphoenolpyruvate carboxykinase (ATP) [Desulfobacterales bacterium]MDD3081482.1 phosphoenolpyruvate carboxykinase (ATP) [Desulfobacterales bacterium]MDD3950443.1 phosphoenolpyruvate carboxykinase (ATP) [Desulfobacterales bacterium]MDY0377760.1 phosphoenolpyruvate carboxykinase (ATP) [Desulfobacterales bacterium]